MARARGQRAHAERPRLLAGGARGDAARARRRPGAPAPLDGIPAALRRVFGDGRAVGADRRPGQRRPLGARLDRPAARRSRSSTPADLELRGGRLLHDGDAGRRGLPPHERGRGRLRRRRAAPRRSLRGGRVKLVNCFGTGIGDDKLAHAYVHDMIRFYLGEEPLLDQVETFDLGEPRHARARARRLRRARRQGPRLLRRARRRHLPARRAGRRRGAARAGARRAGRLRRAAAGRRSPPTRPSSTASSRPATSTCDRSC